MKITGSKIQKIEIEITKEDLAYALMEIIKDRMSLDKNFDDAGCDWLTDKNGNIYIGNAEWFLGTHVNTSYFVDAMNVLKYGRALKI